MRLIDELLKDDFFHGGYRPQAEEAAVQAVVPSSGGGQTKMIALGALAFVVLAALGGGGYYWFAQRPPAPASSTIQTDIAAPAVPPAPAPVSYAAAVTAANEPVTLAAAPPISAAVAVTAPQSAAAPAGAQADIEAKPGEDRYAIAFPKLFDKAAVERLLQTLEQNGIEAKVLQAEETVEMYRLASIAVPAETANDVLVNASLQQVETTPNANGDGTVSFTFGTYASQNDLMAAAAKAAKLGIELRQTKVQATKPAFTITTAAFPKKTAEKHANDLTLQGLNASIMKVP